MTPRTYLVSLISPTSRAICRRSYASTAGQAINKNRPLATAKKTASLEHLSFASNPKRSVKTESRTHVSAGGPAAKAPALHDRKRLTISGGGNLIAKGDPNRVKEKPKDLTVKERIYELDNLIKYASWMPTTDVWGQKVLTLDVMIPHNVISSRHRPDGFKGIWYQFWQNRQNDLKNAIGMITLAKENAFPGVDTRSDGFFRKFFTWPLRAFGITSTRSTSWIAPTRQMFLDNYKDLHAAIAKNDLKEIKRLTAASFATETLTAQRKHNANRSYLWRFHREINPTQVLSLRTTEGYLAPEEPRLGNRLMVHALVKFDTEQSLEIYDREGNPLHEPAKGSVPENRRVPAETQHVVQYFVFEKRMWYDGPWAIREQIWDIVPKKTD